MQLEYILRTARSLRDDYSDDVPGEIVRGTLVCKAQGNWFLALDMLVSSALDFEAIDDTAIVTRYNKLRDYFLKTNIWARPKDATDIQKGNELLDLVICYCEERIGGEGEQQTGQHYQGSA